MVYPIGALFGGNVSFSDYPPKLILICGPCRVGTTALSVVFAKAGIESHMQPIKSARRAKEIGEKIVPWGIGIKKEKFAVAKETFGPHSKTEFFNPIEILLGVGYPKERLVLIPILREPAQVFSSWKEKWGIAKLSKLVKAYELTIEVKESAEKEGILVIPYAHEMIRDNQPAAVLAILFERLGLTIHQLFLTLSAKWENLKAIENVFLYDEPPDRFIEGIGKRGRYEYRDRFVCEEDATLVESDPQLKQIYQSFYEECEANLGIRAMC